MAGFAALAGGRGDENDVSAGGLERDAAGGEGFDVSGPFDPRSQKRDLGHPRASEHVDGGGVAEAEDTVDVGGDGAMPLGGGHIGDGGGDGRPDAVIGNENVEIAKGSEGGGDENLAGFGGGEDLLDGEAEGWAAEFGGKSVGLIGGLLVAEGDTGSGLAEEADGGGADAARASGDQGGAAGEREGDSGGGWSYSGLRSDVQ